MRKRVINHVADTIFWYILYFLPVLAYLFFVVSAPFNDDIEGTYDKDFLNYNSCYRYTIPAGTSFDVLPEPLPNLSVGAFIFMPENPDLALTSIPFVIVDASLGLSDSIILDKALVLEGSFVEVEGTLSYTYTTLFDFSFFTSDPIPEVSVVGYSVALFSEDYSINYSVATNLASSFFLNSSEQLYIYDHIPFLDLSAYDFKDFVNSMGFEFATNNIIVNSLSDIFGTGGIMPMFDNDTPFIIFAWFIGVYLLHLLVDFLLFIPRIAHKWMKDCTGGD